MKGVGMHCRIKKNTRVKESYYGMVCMFFHHTSELKPVSFVNYLFFNCSPFNFPPLSLRLFRDADFFIEFFHTQDTLNSNTHSLFLYCLYLPFSLLVCAFRGFILFLFSLRRKFFFFKSFFFFFWFFLIFFVDFAEIFLFPCATFFPQKKVTSLPTALCRWLSTDWLSIPEQNKRKNHL